jgi:4-phytase/acid phosphatase
MQHLSRGNLLLVFCLCVGTSLAAMAQAPAAVAGGPQQDEELKFVVVLSRHGVRSPTGKTNLLNQYSAQPWPAWSVPPGYLTDHGAKLMTLMGAYDRELLASQGLLSKDGCADAGHVSILADSDQRTRETGKALAMGLMPGCNVPVHALAEGTPDPLFHPLEAGVGHPDKQLALAAISGRIGNDPAGLAEAYRPQLHALEEVLAGPKLNDTVNASPKLSIFDIPSVLAPGKGDHLVDMQGPLSTASTMTENLLLEYTEGMEPVGWGRVDAEKLRELMQLHTASADIERRASYLARVQSSNLLAHILDSMQQAIVGMPVAGALGNPGDRLLILVGHDTNLSNVSGALNLSWLIDGRRDDTPPGGALVFEVWRRSGSPGYVVRAYYTAQTLDQMRNAAPLTLAAPPQRVAVFVPACSGADGSCGWSDFEAAIRAAIDTTAVR